MRGTLSVVLISLLAFPLGPVVAHEVEAVAPGQPEPALTLKHRLNDMPREVERFVESKREADWAWAHNTFEQESPDSKEAVEAARRRVKIRMLPQGTEISVVLRDGRKIRGELADAADEEFGLMVPQTEFRRGPKIKVSIRYDDVVSSELPETSRWKAVEEVQDIPAGKRIEVLLLDETRVEGSLARANLDGFVLTLDDSTTREFSLNEVASVREIGLPTRTKVGIGLAITGLAVSAFALWFLIALSES